MVYEFDISKLSDIDARWGIVWQNFILSCSYPSPSNVLTQLSVDVYNRSKNQDPRLFCDDFLEGLRCIRKFWRSRTGRSQCVANRRRIDENNGWYASLGKYERKGENSSNILVASMNLEALLNTRLSRRIRGNFYYPPGGYREWHSNKYDTHGWRMYLVHTQNVIDLENLDTYIAIGGDKGNRVCYDEVAAAKADESCTKECSRDDSNIPKERCDRQHSCAFFRYKHPTTGKVHTQPDFDGCVRLFYISGGNETIWHTIYSEGHRWSLGYLLSDQAAAVLIDGFRMALQYK